MEFTQSVIMGIAYSGPIAILLGIVRTLMFLDRSIRAKHTKFALIAGLGILLLLALLAGFLAVWFFYGVAHTGKDATTDLIVLASTVIPAYLGALFVWRLSVYLEKKWLRRSAI